MNILDINSMDDKFLFKNGNYDLAMTLLGEGKTRFDDIQCKRNLGGRCFIRAVFYKIIYNTRHCLERKGAREQHLHLHMVFHLLFLIRNIM